MLKQLSPFYMNNSAAYPLRNKSGQIMQRKGIESRHRVVEATARLLRQKSVAELKVTDIVHEAGSSKPNFYLYFDDVLDAVLAAVENVTMDTPKLIEIIESDWPENKVMEYATMFVTTYLKQWIEHSHVLRARNSLVANGDPRFWEAELQATKPLLHAIGKKIELRQQNCDPLHCLHPYSAAGAFLAMLERLGAYGLTQENQLEITPARIIESISYMMASLLVSPEKLKTIPFKSGD